MDRFALTSDRPKDYIYMLVFALGMLFLWLSSHAGVRLSSHPGQSYLLTVALADAIYVIGVLAAAFLWASRRLKALLLGALIALIIAPLLDWLIGLLAAGRVNSLQDLGIYHFILYLIFGLLYVAVFELIRRLSRPHAAV